jgi:hypothetical protein
LLLLTDSRSGTICVQVASHDSQLGFDGYWQTVMCGGPVMRSGRHSATFTVVRGGRTLNVGVVRSTFNPKKPTTLSGNASDTLAGWGFDSESGGCAATLARMPPPRCA